MFHKVVPLQTEIFDKNGSYTIENCATFELQNKGDSTITIDQIYTILPGETLNFQPIANSMYEGTIPFKFVNEGEQKNNLTVVASKYETCN